MPTMDSFTLPPLPGRIRGNDALYVKQVADWLERNMPPFVDHLNLDVKVTSDSQDATITDNAADIATNAADIATNVADIAINVAAIAALAVRMTAAEADIDTLEAWQTVTVDPTLTDHETRILALE